MNSPAYYAIIPAEIRYSDMPGNAKLLYGEITALAGQFGYCFAKNEYFMELYQVSERTVSRWISDMEKRGFVYLELKNDQRRIYINGWTKMSTRVDKNVQEGRQKCPPFPIPNKNSNTAHPRVRTGEDKKEKTEEYETMWGNFISENPDVKARPASIAVYLAMRELGYRPTEPPEAFRKWLAELGTLKGCSAKELEDVATEWKLYWMARPEKPVKNHKTSYMNSITFSKKTWTSEPSKK